MKRFFPVSLICLLFVAPVARSQDAATASAIAARQEAAENYNSLKGHVEDLIAAQADMTKQIQSLRKDIEDLRRQMNQPSSSYASAEALKQVADTLAEVDKKRIADNELVLTEIHKAAAGVSAPTHTVVRLPPPDAGPSTPNSEQNGFYYIIKKDDSLSIIAQMYHDQGVKVSVKQIQDANPNVNPAKLHVGTKLFIPGKAPAGK